ncbi:hypothetical protein AYI96_04790 [Shewanella sp. MSW]|nr:hypothetical protein AYI96_04790 [Shewanella sp. MSW]
MNVLPVDMPLKQKLQQWLEKLLEDKSQKRSYIERMERYVNVTHTVTILFHRKASYRLLVLFRENL